MRNWQITILKYITQKGENNTDKNNADKYIVINENANIQDYNDKVFIVSNLVSKNKIIKIKNANKCIYRKPIGGSGKGISQNEIALTYNSRKELEVNAGDVNLIITSSCFSHFMFYWKNPYYAIRISFKLGLLSIFLGIVSLFTAIISLTL